VTAEGVETRAGDGHYVEVVAHFEKQPGKGPAKEVVVGTFRLKDDSGGEKALTGLFGLHLLPGAAEAPGTPLLLAGQARGRGHERHRHQQSCPAHNPFLSTRPRWPKKD
jgi:hypothetical protein